MNTTPRYLTPPTFSTQERRIIAAVRDFLGASHGWPSVAHVETPEGSITAPEDHPLGEYVAFTLGDPETEDPRFTVQLTREPGRRFVLLGDDGADRGAGNDLASLLWDAVRPA